MTLYEIIDTLKKIALTQPNIRTATDGDIFDKMNGNPSVRYGVFHITQTTHTEDDQFDNYGFNLFVLDRLEDDDSNRVSAQSTAKQILSNIIATFCETFDAENEVITYQPFTQRFKDNTCGVWATVTMQVIKSYSCAEAYGEGVWRPEIVIINNEDITITENGIYEPSEGFTGFGKVEVALPYPLIKESDTLYLTAGDTGVYRPEEPYDGVAEVVYEVEPNQNKRLEVIENGDYTVMADVGYGGIGLVEINVNVPDLNGSYDEGYDVGFGAGMTEGYDSGYSTGYETGNADGYQRGVDEGVANLPTLDITENGVYDQPNKGVTVNVTPKINVIDAGLKFGFSKFSTLPDYFYFPDVIRLEGNLFTSSTFDSMFYQCINLTDLSFLENVREYTEIVNSNANVLEMSSMFSSCSGLEDITPLRNLRVNVVVTNGTNIIIDFEQMFRDSNVKDFTPIEHMLDDIDDNVLMRVNDGAFASRAITRFDLNWPWSRVVNYSGMFNGLITTPKLEYVCELDATSVTSGYNPLNILNVYSSYPSLTYFGGFRNQKLSIDNTYFLYQCPNLTRESCLAIVNNLYDFTANGETPASNQGKLKVNPAFIDNLGDDIEIAISRGWQVLS